MFWDPLMRAAALGQMEKKDEARKAVAKLLELVPDFNSVGRTLIGRYVKVDDLIDKLVEGLQKAGLDDLK